MEVIAKIIYDYLAESRHITVPTLGTFIIKEDRATILFSEFIKSDDGVLSNLLIQKSGMSEIDATAKIELFTAEIRASLERGTPYEIPQIGLLQKINSSISLINQEASEKNDTEQNYVKEQSKEINNEKVSEEEQEQIAESIFNSLSSLIVTNEVEDEKIEVAVDIEKASPKLKYDIWLIVAAVAGAFALFALLYGVIVEWQIGNISFGRAIDSLLINIFE